MTTKKKLMTAEELLKLPEDEWRYELLDGVLVEMPLRGALHGLTLGQVGYLIISHVLAHGLGEVLLGRTGIILRRNPDRVRAPDICFTAGDRIPSGGTPDGYLDLMPDFAVEITSPFDRPGELHQKAEEWIQAGVHLVWVIDPSARIVAVYRPGAPVRTLTETDTLNAEPVLPGFYVAVVDLFS